MDNEEQPVPAVQPKVVAPFEMDRMAEVMECLRRAMTGTESDIDQEELVKVVQKNRAFILEYAMRAYLDNPKSASLLEGVTQMFAQIEKTVRDDRKERAKKKEAENNVLGFGALMDALGNIANGSIRLPVFDLGDFILDPNKSIMQDPAMEPIKDDELVQGNSIVDIDGNKV